MANLQGTQNNANRTRQRRNSRRPSAQILPYYSAVHLTKTCSSPARIPVRQNAQEHFRWFLHGYTTSFACLQDSGPGTTGLREKNATRRNNIGSTCAEFTCTRLRYIRGCVTLMFVCGFHYVQVHVRVLPDPWHRYCYWCSTAYYKHHFTGFLSVKCNEKQKCVCQNHDFGVRNR